MSTHIIGPEHGTLRVKTYREGLASKVGHDLVLDVAAWQATVHLNGATSSISLDADAGSLQVREGLRGAKPLTDKDRGDIRKNIENKVLRGQPIRFRSQDVRVQGEQIAVRGELAIGAT